MLYRGEKKDTKEHMLHDSIYMKFQKKQNESVMTEDSSGCLGLRWEIASKGAQRNSLGDGNVLYHDRGDGYEGVCIYQNSFKCTLKMEAFYCT